MLRILKSIMSSLFRKSDDFYISIVERAVFKSYEDIHRSLAYGVGFYGYEKPVKNVIRLTDNDYQFEFWDGTVVTVSSNITVKRND